MVILPGIPHLHHNFVNQILDRDVFFYFKEKIIIIYTIKSYFYSDRVAWYYV